MDFILLTHLHKLMQAELVILIHSQAQLIV